MTGVELEKFACSSPVCSPSSGGPDLSVALRLINHCPANVAPAAHIRLRINAFGGGDLVNPTATTIGHGGSDWQAETLFHPKTVEDKPNKSESYP